MITKSIHIQSQQELADIFGPYDENIKEIKIAYSVDINIRKNMLEISGKSRAVSSAIKAIEIFRIGGKPDLSEGETEISDLDFVYRTHKGKDIVPGTPAQKKYVESMKKNPVTIATGPAGTGKTFLAVASALKFLAAGRFSKIILSRPIVEAGERLGFLPGDFEEKVNPYFAPLHSAFVSLIGARAFSRQKASGVVEIIPLAYMRGRTLDDAFIILDEAQNTTALQMKMILTRLGPSGIICINGDETQIDLDQSVNSGLMDAVKVLADIKGIEIMKFTKRDVVRHPLVKKIIEAYGEPERTRRDIPRE